MNSPYLSGEDKAMITRKALVAKLQKMSPDVVLFASIHRSTEQAGGWRGNAAQSSLQKVIEGVSSFNQSQYHTARGVRKDTPKWFRQLYTELTWATGDVTPGTILAAIALGA